MKLLAAVSLVAAACSGSPSSPNAPVDRPGRATRFSIGALEAYALRDGQLTPPNDGNVFGLGRPTRETGDLLAAAGLPRDSIHLDIQCLLVKSGDRVILFDTGLGPFVDGDDAGHLPKSLALAGVQPGAVTDVFISHSHTTTSVASSRRRPRSRFRRRRSTSRRRSGRHSKQTPTRRRNGSSRRSHRRSRRSSPACRSCPA